MLLTIICFIYFGIGLFFSSWLYGFSFEKFPDRSFSLNFATALLCVAYFAFWPIIFVINIGSMMGKKIYDEEKKENENS